MRFDYPLSVTVLIINENGEMLHISRRDNHEAFGLVGGKVDPGETLDQAAIRETKEEVGADIELIDVVHSGIIPSKRWGGRDFYNVTYRARLLSEARNMPGEGVIKWHAGWDLLLSGPFGEYNRRLMEALVKLESSY